MELRKILKRREEENNRGRARHNVVIQRNSTGKQAGVRDKVLVKVAFSKLVREGVHVK